MKKYKLKSNPSFVIEVAQLTKKSFNDVLEFVGKSNVVTSCEYTPECFVEILSLSIHLLAKDGEYIAKQISGDYGDIFSLIKPDFLAENYEEVKGEN